MPLPRWSLRVVAAVGALALTVGVAACSDDDTGSGSPSTTAPASGDTTDAGAGAVSPVDQATLESIVAEVGEATRAPGLVALVRTPEGTLTHAWGTRTFGGGEPVTLADHVRIGSNTKPMTTTAILQLAQEGKLSLDDPVSRYRPEVPNGDAITIAMLLDMRSGLFNYSETVEMNQVLDDDPTRAWNQDELLALAFANEPYFPPDGGYHYSNTNTVLLGLIAEQLDGKPLAEVLQDRFFGPLGLEGTSFPDITSNAIPDPHPQGYMYGSNVETLEPLSEERVAAAEAGTFTPGDVTDENPSWAWSAGAAISTVEDLATWVTALAEGDLLDAEWQQRRLDSIRPTVEGNPSAPDYGYGIAAMGPLLGHTGELPGFNSFMGHDPEHDVTVVVWSNLNQAPATTTIAPAVQVARALIAAMYGSTDGAGAPSGAS